MKRWLLWCGLLKNVCEGQRPPAWYGRAWYEFDYMHLVAAPLGLNWLFGWIRNGYLLLRRGPGQLIDSGRAIEEATGLAESAAVLAATCERRHTLDRVRREFAARN